MADYKTLRGNAPVTLTIVFLSPKEAENLLDDLTNPHAINDGTWSEGTREFIAALKDAASPPKLH
jgi:hypothetical protein